MSAGRGPDVVQQCNARGALYRAEAARGFLLQFDDAPVLVRLVMGEGNIRVGEEEQGGSLVLLHTAGLLCPCHSARSGPSTAYLPLAVSAGARLLADSFHPDVSTLRSSLAAASGRPRGVGVAPLQPDSGLCRAAMHTLLTMLNAQMTWIEDHHSSLETRHLILLVWV